jgi:hypothetical protein
MPRKSGFGGQQLLNTYARYEAKRQGRFRIKHKRWGEFHLLPLGGGKPDDPPRWALPGRGSVDYGEAMRLLFHPDILSVELVR